jgi:hypothetical protein
MILLATLVPMLVVPATAVAVGDVVSGTSTCAGVGAM